MWYFGSAPLTKARKVSTRIMLPGSYGRVVRGAAESTATQGQTLDAFLPEFIDRQTFLSVMDEQSIEAALVMAGQAVNVPFDLRFDPEAAHANVRAFNKWLAEDWGLAFQDRIFGVPIMVLFDPELAEQEVERVINDGARAILLNTGPVLGRSPADRIYDGFWARVNEARIPVIFHIDYFGYHDFFSAAWGEMAAPTSEADVNAFQWLTCAGSRPMMDMVASLVTNNLFGRFPNVNVVSVSNGSTWIRDLQRLDNYTSPDFAWPRNEATWWKGGHLTSAPSDTIREHVYVAPFIWDDMSEVLEYVPASRILMATDYPHPDGFAEASDYLSLLEKLDGETTRAITHDNLHGLIHP
jgi:predicted TIM-barrel fold metal-dependent hydrolase